MGGAFAFTAAALLPGLKAAVPFYGIPDQTKVDLSKIRDPRPGRTSPRPTSG